MDSLLGSRSKQYLDLIMLTAQKIQEEVERIMKKKGKNPNCIQI